MAELNLRHGWLSIILSKIFESVIRKKLGYDAVIDLSEVHVTADEDKVFMSVDISARMKKEDFNKMVKSFI